MSFILPVLFWLAFALAGLAYALDFRGLSSRAARNLLWNRGRSRHAAGLTFIQRGIGAVIALAGLTMAVLIFMAGV